MTNHQLVQLARVRRLARSGEAQALRLSAGLSLREMADAIGISHSNLWLWERGQRSPRNVAALAWAALLDDLAAAQNAAAA
jgi:transcriptional regulator with XRE-family HTH domain